MLSRLMFIKVNMHVNLCNMHGNYLKTTHIKVVTNEKMVPLTSSYASKVIDSSACKIGGPLR